MNIPNKLFVVDSKGLEMKLLAHRPSKYDFRMVTYDHVDEKGVINRFHPHEIKSLNQNLRLPLGGGFQVFPDKEDALLYLQDRLAEARNRANDSVVRMEKHLVKLGENNKQRTNTENE